MQLFESIIEATDVAGLVAQYSPAIGAGVLGYGVGTLINNTVCGAEACSDILGGDLFNLMNPQDNWPNSTPLPPSVPQQLPPSGPPSLPPAIVCSE